VGKYAKTVSISQMVSVTFVSKKQQMITIFIVAVFPGPPHPAKTEFRQPRKSLDENGRKGGVLSTFGVHPSQPPNGSEKASPQKQQKVAIVVAILGALSA
jgi:hypothetical protein